MSPDLEPPPELLAAFANLDQTFSEDRGTDMAAFFREDGRLMWPFSEDIVGRRNIQIAFENLVETFATISWQPEPRFECLTADAACVLGRFIEIRKRRLTGQVEKVYGRLVELWQRQPNGQWRLSVLLTSRYADDEVLTAPW